MNDHREVLTAYSITSEAANWAGCSAYAHSVQKLLFLSYSRFNESGHVGQMKLQSAAAAAAAADRSIHHRYLFGATQLALHSSLVFNNASHATSDAELEL